MAQMQISLCLIPFSNHEQYLKQCLASLSEQTHQHFEVFLIDTGSEDNSLNLAQDYVAQPSFLDPRVRT